MKLGMWLAVLFSGAALAACDDDLESAIEEASASDAAVQKIRVSNAGVSCSLLNRSCQGSAPQCLEVSYSGAYYPGGYCTADCRQSADCGLDAVCPVGEADRLTPGYPFRSTWARKCFKTCVPNPTENPCRPGYACVSLAEAYLAQDAPAPMHTPVCLPRWPSPSWDAGAQSREHRDGTNLTPFDAGR